LGGVEINQVFRDEALLLRDWLETNVRELSKFVTELPVFYPPTNASKRNAAPANETKRTRDNR